MVIGGEETNVAALREACHETVKEKIIGTFKVDTSAANFTKVLELAAPIAVECERTREAQAVDAVADAVGSGNKGVAGAIDVLKALEQGQVFRLVMSGDYTEMGWADYTMPIYGIGDFPAEHPAGGDLHNLVPVPLEQEMIRQALVTGAQIEIVDPSVPVDTEGAVPKDGPSAGIGMVTSIAGVSRFRGVFAGQRDHAGTTPMTRRHDAGCAAAGTVLAV